MLLFLKNKKGFTLIELLVVVAIIGVLASVVLSSLNTARAKARDVQRISHVREIQKALELFYDDNGYYPRYDFGTSTGSYVYSDYGSHCGGSSYWCTLETSLSPYISTLPRDPLGETQLNYYFIYRTHGNGQSYGLSSMLEKTQNASVGDGGCSAQWFEVGPSLARCGCTPTSWFHQGTDVCP